MTINDFTQLISGVGFPIAACCVMWYQNQKMQETLCSISSTMQLLTDKIERIEDKMNE